MTRIDIAQTSANAGDADAAGSSATPLSPAAKTAMPKPFLAPAASNIPVAERRTWEGYASDFRALSAQLAGLQQERDAARTERDALVEQYAALQRQRRDDQNRLALIARARDALEANSAAQASRTRSAQGALSIRDMTIAELKAERQQLLAEINTFRAGPAVFQDDHDRLADANAAQDNHARKTIGDRDATIAELETEKGRLLAEIDNLRAARAVLRNSHDRLAINSAVHANHARTAENTLATRNMAIAGLEAERHRLLADISVLKVGQALETPWATPTPAPAVVRLPAAIRMASHRMPPSLLDRIAAALMLRRARQAARRGYWTQAEVLYEAVVVIRNDPRIWMQLGHAYREQRAYAEAASAYREALTRAPENAEYHFMLGLAETGRGDTRTAREAYRRALALDSGLIDIYEELRDPSLQD